MLDQNWGSLYLQVVGWGGHHHVAFGAHRGPAHVAWVGTGRRGGGAAIANYYNVKAKAKSTDYKNHFSPPGHTWCCSDGVRSSSLSVACTPHSAIDKLVSQLSCHSVKKTFFWIFIDGANSITANTEFCAAFILNSENIVQAKSSVTHFTLNRKCSQSSSSWQISLQVSNVLACLPRNLL